MDELEKGISICMKGRLAKEALRAFHLQLKKWDIVMPPVEPLVLDFGLKDFYHTGLIEYWIANETEAGYCGKYLFVFDGQTCPKHRHEEKLETFCIVKGQVRMFYDGIEDVMEPGDVLRIETCKYHSFTGIGPALLLEVSKPCIIDDNYFENTKIPIGGNYFVR